MKRISWVLTITVFAGVAARGGGAKVEPEAIERERAWWSAVEWSDVAVIGLVALLLVLFLLLGLGVSHPIRME
jgi:hypothetical protein